MKNFAKKATLAACLLLPVMAMAADSGAASFTDKVDLGFKLDGKGFTSIDATWTDLSAALKKGGTTQQFQASSLVWKLFEGNTLKLSGSFADVAGDSNSGKIVINESLVGSGEYKVKFAGNWVLDGQKEAWKTKVEEKVYLSAPYSVSPVPEPETYAMLLAGLGLVATIAIRRKKSDAV